MSAEIIHGDCLDAMRTLEAGSVHAVVTSPPYAEQRKAQYGGIPEKDYPAWTVAWLDALRPALAPRASVLINIREHVRNGEISDYVHRTRLAVRGAGWVECDELIWVKPLAPPVGHPARPRRSWERVLWFSQSRDAWCDAKANGRKSRYVGMTGSKPGWVASTSEGHDGVARSRDYIEVPITTTPAGDRHCHPASYPLGLAEWLIGFSAPTGGLVLDPFAGSGTTGAAALRLGRSFIGIEREAAYVEIARKRIADAQTQLTLSVA